MTHFDVWCRGMANPYQGNEQNFIYRNVRATGENQGWKKIKIENIKEIMGVKGKRDIIQKKRLQWYGHVKRMPEERIPKLILEWVPVERRKRVRPRKTWMEGVHAAMTERNLEQNQWRNRE
jgi:hypothetical protein